MLAPVLALILVAGPAPAQAQAAADAASAAAAAPPLRYYPELAQKLGVEGDVTMACTATADGRLTSCTILSETPPGYGFGQTALDLAPSFKLNATAGGEPVRPGKVVVPLNFRLPH
jgi:protein TonB